MELPLFFAEQQKTISQVSHKELIILFNQLLSLVNPYTEEGRPSFPNKYLFNERTLPIEKLVPAIVVIFPPYRPELLIGEETESGYRQAAHAWIEHDYKLDSKNERIFPAILFTIANRKYLVISCFQYIWGFENEDTEKSIFVKQMIDYGINAVLTPKSEYFENKEITIEDQITDQFIIETPIDSYDDLVRNDWILNMAKEHGWTNTEMIRFRLLGELPPKKRRH